MKKQFAELQEAWSGPVNGKQTVTGRCYETHPALKLTKEGVEYLVYGGSCHSPVVKDADIYIALDGWGKQKQAQPWEEQSSVIYANYPITDMHAPENSSLFRKMIDWLCNQLQAGKKIHIGCIGGHGRTGTVLSALTAAFTGEKDAIQYVRENYCHKAVESRSQVQFLMKHYDVSEIGGAKEGGQQYLMGNWHSPDKFSSVESHDLGGRKHYPTTQKSFPTMESYNSRHHKDKSFKSPAIRFSGSKHTYHPVVGSPRLIW